MKRTAAVAMALLLAIAPALTDAATPKSKKSAVPSTTPYLFSADEVRFDQDLGLIVAKGHVEMSQGDQILLADTVSYNQHTDTATASGHVSLLQPGGDIMFADFAQLQDDFKDGFVRDIRLLLSDRSRLAGNTARRTNGTRTEIRRGVYSACDLCEDDPTRAPVWQIKADTVIRDQELQIVEYRDAEVDIDGIPVMWLPYFEHPDPSVKRASGFLPPQLGYSSSLGAHMEIPFYWAISPDKDMTIMPMITTAAGVVLYDDYRERFSNGQIELQGSLGFATPQVEINAAGQPIATGGTTPGVRGHIFGNGEFDLDDDWRVSFNAARSTDLTYLLLYHFPSPPDFLTSDVSLENFQPNSYFNASAYAFQSLWPGVLTRTEPFAAPLMDYMWVVQPGGGIGGQLTLAADALDLVRETGISQRRLSASASWDRSFNGLVGDRFELYVSGRGDGYSTTGVPNPESVTGATMNTDAARIFPQAAVTWSYPWVRRSGGYTELIEPVAMAVTAPNTGNFSKISNEDSQAFDFDDTSLFVPDRLQGYDLVDTGSRIDYGLRGGIYSDRGGSVRFLVGESYAFQNDTEFSPGSGLTTRLSDLVGRVTLTPFEELNLIYRFRLGEGTFASRTQEIAAQLGPESFNFTLSYEQLSGLADYPYLVNREEAGAALSLQLTRHWFLDLQELYDFDNNVNLGSAVGVTYRDECLSFTASVAQSGIEIADVKPGVSVLFTFVFKNLGEFGLHVASFND
jgi:LPS-assembly protein